MKKLKLFCVTIFFCILLLSSISFATEENNLTDFSNVELELKSTISGNSVSYKLYFNNVTFEKTHNYSVWVTNSKDDVIEYTSSNDGAIIDGVFNNINKFLERKGDIYITVVEESSEGKEIVLLSKKLERPNQNDIGKRITGSFFTEKSVDKNIIFFNEPHDSSEGDRNIKVKIGKVEDEKILNNIKANGSSALKELLSYAKNQTGLHTDTLPANTSSNTFLSKIQLENNGYYFIYFEADDENGKYYPVEDVMLAQAKIMQNGQQIQLVNYTDGNFVWKTNTDKGNTVNNTITNSNNEIDNTVANKIIPAAGIDVYITLFVIAVILISGIAYVKYKKYKIVK